MSIIALSGNAGSGKDEIANYLCNKYGFTKVSLADPIKRFGFHVFEFSENQLWGPSNCRNIIDNRYQIAFDVQELGWSKATSNILSYGPTWLAEVAPDKDHKQLMHTLWEWFMKLKKDHPYLSPRIMLQHLGVEWGREVVGTGIWLQALVRTIDQIKDGYSYDPKIGTICGYDTNESTDIVCADVRFSNEIYLMKKKGACLVRVIRPASQANALTVGIKNHKTESAQLGIGNTTFNAIIENNGTLQDLYIKIDNILNDCRND